MSGQPGGRIVRTLASELRSRGIEVIEPLSNEDGVATIVSDAVIPVGGYVPHHG
jgi:hypothetical protein